jgi:hypothetical protein
MVQDLPCKTDTYPSSQGILHFNETQKFLNQSTAPNTTMHQFNPLQTFWPHLMIHFKTAILFTLIYPNGLLHSGFHFTNVLHVYYALDM